VRRRRGRIEGEQLAGALAAAGGGAQAQRGRRAIRRRRIESNSRLQRTVRCAARR